MLPTSKEKTHFGLNGNIPDNSRQNSRTSATWRDRRQQTKCYRGTANIQIVPDDDEKFAIRIADVM